MVQVTYGDRATQYRTLRLTSQVKMDLDRLTEEVATGRTTNVGKAVASNFTPLGGLRRSVETLEAYAVTNAEAQLTASSMQAVLTSIADSGSGFSASLITAGNANQSLTTSATAAQGRSVFEGILSSLNTRVGGRSLFAGVSTDTTAFADVETIMTSLRAATASATSVSDVVAAVDAWFDTPGGGFETDAYLGSTTAITPFRLSDNERASLDVTGFDSAFRDVLKGYALTALVDDGILSSSDDQRSILLFTAGEKLLSSEGSLANMRARVGAKEQQIEEAMTRNSVQAASYSSAISEISAIDTYESASALTQVQTQLETIYTITARLSNLNLADYL